MEPKVARRKCKVAIVGAGPAGSSLAIRLAEAGLETVLIEREKFPRQKLCGEFISPECFRHFVELGVSEAMFASGGDRIFETRFFETGGSSIAIPSGWFSPEGYALSLSRAEMDLRLLERARQAGVDVLEGVAVIDADLENGRLTKVRARSEGGDVTEIPAEIFVDASGRASILTKLAGKAEPSGHPSRKPAFVGFKTHLSDAGVEKGVCEVYSFPGGYAGLSRIESGLTNLCFLVRAETVRSFGSDAEAVVEKVVRRNKRAAETLSSAAADKWLAVSIDSYGTKDPTPAANLFAVGDAASFIDPFTGSGMVMALESAEILADAINSAAPASADGAARYREAYRHKFSRRLRVCSLLRRTAFMPRAATAAVAFLGTSVRMRRSLARITRR